MNKPMRAMTPAKAWPINAVGEAAGLELDSGTLDTVVSGDLLVNGVSDVR